MLCLFFLFLLFTFLFLFSAMPCGVQDLSFPRQPVPSKAEAVLNTGLSEKSIKSVLFWIVSIFMPLISFFFSNVYSVINSI